MDRLLNWGYSMSMKEENIAVVLEHKALRDSVWVVITQGDPTG